MWNDKPPAFLGFDSDYQDADAILFGAPFDSTTSYRPGTRFASRAMRAESYGLETYSPYQDRDLTDLALFDGGDLELPFGDPARALDMIEKASAQILGDGKLPVMLGGEHLVTLGALRAAVKRHPDLHIIHFDAHADLRDDYLGSTLSHASVMRRAWELTGDEKIFQFGIRSGDRSEFEWAKGHVTTRKFDLEGVEALADRLADKPIYLTLDLDVLDPSALPGTGTPEAGGVTFQALLGALLSLKGLNIVAFDINELSPPLDQSGASTATALKLLREMLLAFVPEKKQF